MSATEQVVPAKYLKKYDRIYRAGRWRSVISAEITTPPTDEEVEALRERVSEASDELALMEAAFALAYSVKRRRQWAKAVVRVHLGTAGALHFAEYEPDAMVTVRRPAAAPEPAGPSGERTGGGE